MYCAPTSAEARIWSRSEDEEADGDAGFAEPRDGAGEGGFGGDDVEAAFGGDFGAAFGDEADFVRLERLGDGDDFRHVGHFEVHFGADGFAERVNVAILDVASVFAEVDGDAVRARRLGLGGGEDGIRFGHDFVVAGLVAGLSERGDVVNVDAELEHGWNVSRVGNEDNKKSGRVLRPAPTEFQHRSVSSG